MLSDLAFHLARRGWDVGVITSRQLYDDPAARLEPTERVRGVDVRRVRTTSFGRASLPLRALDYASFYASAWLALRRERQSLVVALTDPPLISIVAALASRRVVNWVQDLFPEVATAVGIRMPAMLARLRDWSTRRARMNVVIGESMRNRIRGATVVRHNWAGGDLHPTPRTPGAPFTVVYSGNLGRVHDVDTLVAAMEHLPDVRFRMIGGGAGMDRLAARAIANVTIEPYVPRDALLDSLGDADVHLVSLKPELEGLVVPSKFYGVLAVGRPVLYVGRPDGEIGKLVREARCGLVVEPGDVPGLVEAIRRLARERAWREELGRHGRSLYEDRFDSQAAFRDWERILRESFS